MPSGRLVTGLIECNGIRALDWEADMPSRPSPIPTSRQFPSPTRRRRAPSISRAPWLQALLVSYSVAAGPSLSAGAFSSLPCGGLEVFGIIHGFPWLSQ